MMKKPLFKRYRDLSIGCVASLLLVLTGCDDSGVGPVGPPGAIRGGAIGPSRRVTTHTPSATPGTLAVGPKAATPFIAPVAANPLEKEKPPEGEETKKEGANPLAPVAPIEQGGNLVNLASELISAGVNPFLNRLPRTLQTDPNAVAGSTVAQSVTPPADPLDSVKLMGVIYSPQSPIALISVAGATASSQLVRMGDVIELTGAQAVVAHIAQDSIELQLQGHSQESKTLSIPDIVGYASSKDTPAAVASGALDSLERGKGGSPGMGGLSSGPGGLGLPQDGALGNLTRLVQQLAGGSGTGQGSATNAGGIPSSSSADMSSGSPNVVLTKP